MMKYLDSLIQRILLYHSQIFTQGMFGFFIHTRSNSDNNLHGSGLNTNDILLEFKKENTGTGNLTMYSYVIAHSQFNIENRQPTSLHI